MRPKLLALFAPVIVLSSACSDGGGRPGTPAESRVTVGQEQKVFRTKITCRAHGPETAGFASGYLTHNGGKIPGTDFNLNCSSGDADFNYETREEPTDWHLDFFSAADTRTGERNSCADAADPNVGSKDGAVPTKQECEADHKKTTFSVHPPREVPPR